jgi:hypothetical protein
LLRTLLKTLVLRAAAVVRPPERDRNDPDGTALDRRLWADDVVMFAEDLRNLLTVVAECAGAMHGRAEKGLPAYEELRDLQAACDRSNRIVRRLSGLHTVSWYTRDPIDVNGVILDCRDLLERALGSRIRLTLVLTENREYVLAGTP